MKLSWGERAKKEDSIEFARSLFLKALRKCAPEALDDLQREVYPSYLALDDEARYKIHHFWKTQRFRLEPLPERMLTWAERWHLNEPWCLERMLVAFRYWDTPIEDRSHDWEGDDWTGYPSMLDGCTEAEERLFQFEHEVWHDLTGLTDTGDTLIPQNRENIATEIRAAFEVKLTSFLDRLETLAEQRGFGIAPMKTKPEHFEWIVCFQVKNMEYGIIFEKYKRKSGISTVKAVEKAVRGIAKHIDVTLRNPANSVGRPRGSTSPARPRNK